MGENFEKNSEKYFKSIVYSKMFLKIVVLFLLLICFFNYINIKNIPENFEKILKYFIICSTFYIIVQNFFNDFPSC